MKFLLGLLLICSTALASSGSLNIGQSTISPLTNLEISSDQNDATSIRVSNVSSAANAISSLKVNAENSQLVIQSNSSTFAGSAYMGAANGVGIWSSTNASGGITIATKHASSPIKFLATSVELLRIVPAGNIMVPTTVTAAGTTGNRTINKISGTVNIAAAGTAVTVTNSVVSTTSIVLAVARTNDSTCSVKNVVPGSGTFTINTTAACTAETSFGFFVIN